MRFSRATSSIDIVEIRFAGDRELQDALLGDRDVGERLRLGAYERHRATVRRHLLSTAVRVDPRMLPKLAASIASIKERTGYRPHIEAYVFQSAEINAFLTQGDNRTYLGLSSAVVNHFSERELEFVIGHELGHAVYQHVSEQIIARLQDENLELSTRKQVLAWKRASEISADRCGLICCGSIDAAASAMFRTLSGLSTADLQICPRDFSEQWDHLLEEVIRAGNEDIWQLSHPFPPLRMRAMVLFWESDGPLAEVDREVARLLGTMNPPAEKTTASGDLLLEDILLWAGTALIFADDGARQPGREAVLARMVSPEAVRQSTAMAGDRRQALTRMQQALERRPRRLRALEINRILHAALEVGSAGTITAAATMDTFYEVGEILGIGRRACDLVRERYQQRQRTGDSQNG